ncbi:hypothetical protein EVAR_91474_1 [Eumeta japonica]|uniref:Uncharacterized protein n=1 Tax=Eumeta variegata TaxID=151549 RepID=A0A4C1VBC8_EUMVA|nr:hypothetical protein EVAR_91474_1 [Eumeta japonica]
MCVTAHSRQKKLPCRFYASTCGCSLYLWVNYRLAYLNISLLHCVSDASASLQTVSNYIYLNYYYTPGWISKSSFTYGTIPSRCRPLKSAAARPQQREEAAGLSPIYQALLPARRPDVASGVSFGRGPDLF